MTLQFFDKGGTCDKAAFSCKVPWCCTERPAYKSPGGRKPVCLVQTPTNRILRAFSVKNENCDAKMFTYNVMLHVNLHSSNICKITAMCFYHIMQPWCSLIWSCSVVWGRGLHRIRNVGS